MHSGGRDCPPGQSTPDRCWQSAHGGVACAEQLWIRQPAKHLPAAVMGDPGLLQKRPAIQALWPDGGVDHK